MTLYNSSDWTRMLANAKRATEMYDMLSPLEWYIATLFPDTFEEIMEDVHTGEHTKNPIHAYTAALAKEDEPLGYKQALEIARVYFIDPQVPTAVAKFSTLWKSKLSSRIRTELVGKDGRAIDTLDEKSPVEKWAAYLILLSDIIAQDIKRQSLFERIGQLNGVAVLHKQQKLLGANIWNMLHKLPDPQSQSLVWESMHERVDLPHVQHATELQKLVSLNAIMQSGAREGNVIPIATTVKNNIAMYATPNTPRVDDQEWNIQKQRSAH